MIGLENLSDIFDIAKSILILTPITNYCL